MVIGGKYYEILVPWPSPWNRTSKWWRSCSHANHRIILSLVPHIKMFDVCEYCVCAPSWLENPQILAPSRATSRLGGGESWGVKRPRIERVRKVQTERERTRLGGWMVEEWRNFDDIDIVLRFESELRWFDSIFFLCFDEQSHFSSKELGFSNSSVARSSKNVGTGSRSAGRQVGQWIVGSFRILHSFATDMDRINRRKPSISGEKIRTPPLSYHVLNTDVLPLLKKTFIRYEIPPSTETTWLQRPFPSWEIQGSWIRLAHHFATHFRLTCTRQEINVRPWELNMEICT